MTMKTKARYKRTITQSWLALAYANRVIAEVDAWLATIDDKNNKNIKND